MNEVQRCARDDAAQEPGQSRDRGEPVLLPEDERRAGEPVGAVEVPRLQRHPRVERQDVPALGRLRGLGEQPPGPGHPGDPGVLPPAHDLGVAELEGHQGRLHREPRLEEVPVHPGAGLGILVDLPQPPARGRQEAEVLGRQLSRRPERLARRLPVVPVARGAGRLQGAFVRHRSQRCDRSTSRA